MNSKTFKVLSETWSVFLLTQFPEGFLAEGMKRANFGLSSLLLTLLLICNLEFYFIAFW